MSWARSDISRAKKRTECQPSFVWLGTWLFDLHPNLWSPQRGELAHQLFVHEGTHIAPVWLCLELAQRQGCCRCRPDALLQQWACRGTGSQAQIGQALYVWSRQTSTVT